MRRVVALFAALTPVDPRELPPAPEPESPPPPERAPLVTAEERERLYREALGIPNEKRRRRWGRR
jgi:hypothetical protein